MIDTRRAHQMTKMAMFEKREEDKIRIADNYSKKNYVSLWTVIYVVAAVLFYIMYCIVGISAMIAIYTRSVPTGAWIVFGVVATSGFVFHTYFYIKSGKKKAMERYDDSKTKRDYMTEQYKVLDNIYKEK
ncbi:MAG TPA: hypothetical protein DCR12_07945 [Lachnospiraceae bacterium]|nr:hypothetical protein [Lachnospiraceae bacterium]